MDGMSQFSITARQSSSGRLERDARRRGELGLPLVEDILNGVWVWVASWSRGIAFGRFWYVCGIEGVMLTRFVGCISQRLSHPNT